MTPGEYAEIEHWKTNHCIGCVWFKMGCRAYPEEIAKCKEERNEK